MFKLEEYMENTVNLVKEYMIFQIKEDLAILLDN